MLHSVTEKVGPWINAAIDKHGQGEAIFWEPGLLRGQHDEALYTVFVWFPGAVLGTTLGGSFQITNPVGVTEEEIDAILTEFLRQFREARSEVLAKQNGHAQNGHGEQPGSGLIIPGR